MKPEISYPDLLRALVFVESSNDPNAVNAKTKATGLTQILPQYAHRLRAGVPSVYEVADIYGIPYGRESVEEAARLLKIPAISMYMGDKLLQSLVQREKGHLNDAFRAYNMGPKALDEWEASGRNPSLLSDEARDYPQKIRDYYEQITGTVLPEVIAPVRENNIGSAPGVSIRPQGRPQPMMASPMRPQARPMGLLD